MSGDSIDLHPFARRVHSEAGEDGIIEKIFALLGVEQGFFVEFGAWDGRKLSNSRLLVERGWSGVLIEAEPGKFAELQRNVSEDHVTLVNARVALSGEDMLDAILSRADCPERFDLLSIDVDSDDLAIWMTLKDRRPTCVIIEYNVTIPFDVDFINPPGKPWGNSARTIERVARGKGYQLVALSGMNLIFIDAEACKRANIKPTSLDGRSPVMGERLFWGYDGTLLRWRADGSVDSSEFLRIPFHAYRYPQPLPRFLRRWQLGREWHRRERVVAAASALMLRPISYLRSRLRRR